MRVFQNTVALTHQRQEFIFEEEFYLANPQGSTFLGKALFYVYSPQFGLGEVMPLCWNESLYSTRGVYWRIIDCSNPGEY